MLGFLKNKSENHCQHARVLFGGGMTYDLCTCVDCGLEKYEEVFPATRATEVRERPLGENGCYVKVTPEAWENAKPMQRPELLGAISR